MCQGQPLLDVLHYLMPITINAKVVKVIRCRIDYIQPFTTLNHTINPDFWGTTFVHCIKDGDSKYQQSLSKIYLFMEEIHSAKQTSCHCLALIDPP